MRTIKVFYSWQSDLPEKENRYLIRDCLKSAAKEISQELDIESVERDGETLSVEVQHDTDGVAGTPDIMTTILKRIKECDLFIADVSGVGRSHFTDKMLPNPNVLMELGYAVWVLERSEVTLVVNRKYAAGQAEEGPFDMRFRRAPILFNSGEDIAQLKKNLIVDFKRALRTFVSSGLPESSSLEGKILVDFRVTAGQETKELLFMLPHTKQSLSEAETNLAGMSSMEANKGNAAYGVLSLLSVQQVYGFSLKLYEKYVEELRDFYKQVSATVVLDLDVINESNVLVQNCDVILAFPEHVTLSKRLPKPPDVPKAQLIMPMMRAPAIPTFDGLTIKDHKVLFKISELKRGLPCEMPRIFAELPGGINEVEVRYSLVCAVPHEKIDGMLPFTARALTFDEAQIEYEKLQMEP